MLEGAGSRLDPQDTLESSFGLDDWPGSAERPSEEQNPRVSPVTHEALQLTAVGAAGER